jgi:hypothetical protein
VKILQAFNGIVSGQLLLFTVIIELHFTNSTLAIRVESLVKGILKKIFGYKKKEEPGKWRKIYNVNLINCSVFLMLLG